MARRKRARKIVASLNGEPGHIIGPVAVDFISGPKLRAKLGISAVTLWRWRHAKASAFPAPKVINGRLYFSVGAVSDWLAKQPEAASAKAGSDSDAAACDSAVMAWIALQHGVPLESMRRALLRVAHGRPATPLAVALDFLATQGTGDD
jgi:predicted DNA-binding transcriptional regulator AlpA